MKLVLSTIGAIALLLVATGPASASNWPGRLVGRVFAPDDRDCVFFTLAGTPEPNVDPSVAITPWIAIPRSQNGFKEIYAMLLWAKSTGTPVDVTTTGAAASATCTTHGTVVGLYQILTSS